MTFAQQLLIDRDVVFLNQDEFAESITYYPAGGGKRSITAVVMSHKTENDKQRDRTIAITTLKILVSNDPATGVDRPQFKDSILRSIAEDPHQTKYNFHEIVFADTTSYELRFRHQHTLEFGQPNTPTRK